MELHQACFRSRSCAPEVGATPAASLHPRLDHPRPSTRTLAPAPYLGRCTGTDVSPERLQPTWRPQQDRIQGHCAPHRYGTSSSKHAQPAREGRTGAVCNHPAPRLMVRRGAELPGMHTSHPQTWEVLPPPPSPLQMHSLPASPGTRETPQAGNGYTETQA